MGKSARTTITFHIPKGLSFSDLNMRWTEGHQVAFDWEPLEILCEASGIDRSMARRLGEANIARLINHWYEVHRLGGGAVDAVHEEAKRWSSAYVTDMPHEGFADSTLRH